MEPFEMRKHRLPLDSDTIDRLLDGQIDQHDAPPGYAAVASMLSAAATAPQGAEIDDALLGRMVHAIDCSPPSTDRTPSMISKLLTAKVAAGAAALLLTTTGAAAAATGNLPAPAQDAVSEAASRIGVDLPTADDEGTTEEELPTGEEQPTDGDEPGTGDPAGDADRDTGNVDNPTDADQHGVDVSGVARGTELTGREKGAAVSATARGDHGRPTTTTTTEVEGEDEDERGTPADPGSQRPDTTPNGGGADASGGRSEAGAANADAAPGGRP